MKLWCYVQGKDDIFFVTPSPRQTIGDLKRQIRQKVPNFLAARVYPCNLNLKMIDVDRDDILSGQYLPCADGSRLSPQAKICDVWTQQPSLTRVHVFVYLLSGASEPTAGNTSVNALYSAFIKKFEDIFIELENWGSYTESDIYENDIWLETSAPAFVSDFEQELDSKPGLAVDARPFVDRLSIAQSWEAYFGPHEDTSPKDGPPDESTSENESDEKRNWKRRDAQPLEVTHIIKTASAGWEKLWAREAFKRDLANAMFFSHFLLGVPESGSIIAQTGSDQWPFNLVMKCAVEPINKQLRKFQPRSDFLIQKSTLPRLLVVVNSTATRIWSPDVTRMLLAGAAIVRFANTFLNTFKAKNFVLITMFIFEHGKATRFTMFQKPNGRKVYYKETKFSLSDPVGRVTFIRQFYNLFHMLEREEDAGDTENEFQKLQDEVFQNIDSIHTKDAINTEGKKRKRSGTDDGASAREGGGSIGAEDCAQLRARGYGVETEDIVDDSGIVNEPLLKVWQL